MCTIFHNENIKKTKIIASFGKEGKSTLYTIDRSRATNVEMGKRFLSQE